MGFEEFLINEEKSHLGHRVSDVLTGMHDLQTDMENMGSRHLARFADQIVDEIRKIIHGTWGDQQKKYMHNLQRVAVALKKAIEDRDDLKQIIPSASQELQDILQKLGVKTNSLKAPEEQETQGQEIQPQDYQLTPEPQKKPEEQPPGADTGGMGIPGGMGV